MASFTKPGSGITVETESPPRDYEVTTPDGRTVTITGPADATDEEVARQAHALLTADDAKARDTVGGKVDAAGRAIAQGATLNFGDEIASAANAVLPLDALAGKDVQSIWGGKSLKEAFAHNMEVEHRIENADKEASPVITGAGKLVGGVAGVLAGGVGGGVATGLALGGGRGLAAGRALAPLARVAARVPGAPILASVAGNVGVQAGALGAATGAAAGYGEGDTPESRAQSAKLGGAFGGVVGFGLGTTVAGLAPVVGRYWSALRGRDATPAALAQIQRALERDGYDVTSPAGRQALETELQRFAGKPVSLADVGRATRARTGVGLRSTSDAQAQSVDTVLNRQGGQAERLGHDIRATVAPRTDVHAIDENLVQTRDAVALPARDAALVQPTTTGTGTSLVTTNHAVVPSDPVLQGMARLPLAQRALEGARRQAQAERDLALIQGQSISHLPDFPQPGAPMDMKALDYLKRYLDDEVHRAYSSSESHVKAEAPNLRQLRDAIRTRMRSVGESSAGAGDGPYAQYLDTYGDVSEMREALAQGRGTPLPNGQATTGFDRLDPEQIVADQAGRSVASQEFYRVGAARRLQDIVNGVNDTGTAQPATRILNTPTARARVDALGVTPQASTRLNAAVDQERQMGQLTHELRGSQTDERLAARQQVNADGLNVGVPFNPASHVSWLAYVGRRVLGGIDLTRNAHINEAALPRLLEQNPQAIQRTIDELVANGQAQAAAELRRAARARTTGAAAGAIIGAPVATKKREF